MHLSCRAAFQQVHAITLPSGALLLAFDDDMRLRTPLAFAMSRDGGETWCGLVHTCSLGTSMSA